MKTVNFQEFKLSLEENQLVLVDFYADWCGPCRMMAPVIKEISEELNGKAEVLKVNVDEERELAAQYNIVSIPTLMLFKSGKPVAQILGFRPKNVITNLIKQYV